MLTITENAKRKMQSLLAEEDNPNLKVRAFIKGGGCSGFNYGFTFDEEVAEDDYEVEGVLIDSASMQYLQGSIIDWKEDLMSSQFVITNPNATATCGCGQSFAA